VISKLRDIGNNVALLLIFDSTGPLVVLIHGFPQIWYAYRHQIPFLAEAGYHAVALDLRGQGQSDCPDEVEKYTLLHHAGDVIGVINALEEKEV
jgi:pimeloyl-ACP methyl ester carboxylesterase